MTQDSRTVVLRCPVSRERASRVTEKMTWLEETRMDDLVRLRWGLVGTSGFADAVFAPVLRNAGQELLGAVGSSPQGSAAFAVRHGAPRTYESLEAMLRDPDVDAVWIASPNHLHEEHVRMALEAGKHVLAEKPLAITGSGARDPSDGWRSPIRAGSTRRCVTCTRGSARGHWARSPTSGQAGRRGTRDCPTPGDSARTPPAAGPSWTSAPTRSTPRCG